MRLEQIIKNNIGRTALNFVKEKRDRHQEIVELLTTNKLNNAKKQLIAVAKEKKLL